VNVNKTKGKKVYHMLRLIKLIVESSSTLMLWNSLRTWYY